MVTNPPKGPNGSSQDPQGTEGREILDFIFNPDAIVVPLTISCLPTPHDYMPASAFLVILCTVFALYSSLVTDISRLSQLTHDIPPSLSYLIL